MRITDHVYILSGSDYSAVDDGNLLGEVYGIQSPDGFILVDGGVSDIARAQIKEQMDYFGITDKITHLILTHAHFDHCGNARAFQDAGVKVIAGAEDVYQCVNGGCRGLGSPFEGSHFYPAFTPDIAIDSDCEMDLSGLHFRFIKTPGHTPGSLSPLIQIDRKTILFTGDALQPDGRALFNDVSFGWQGDLKFSKTAIVNSMMKLLDGETDMILPGHGKICLKNGSKILRLAAQTAFMTMR